MIDGRSLKPFVPSYVTIVKFAKAYALPTDELLSRAGYEPGIEMHPDEWALIRAYRSLTPQQKQQLLASLTLIQNSDATD